MVETRGDWSQCIFIPEVTGSWGLACILLLSFLFRDPTSGWGPHLGSLISSVKVLWKSPHRLNQSNQHTVQGIESYFGVIWGS